MNIQQIFQVFDEQSFNEWAVKIFHYQYHHLPVYQQYCDLQLKNGINNIDHYTKIPFLPIDFFKKHYIISEDRNPVLEFHSSGTTGQERSIHPIADPALYQNSFIQSFKYFYGDPSSYCFIALLPSYLENNHSSLIYMVNHLISMSQYVQSGFYAVNDDRLITIFQTLKQNKIPTILLGVSYALLDLAEKSIFNLDDIIVMETGGMKGRRKELTREELHNSLKKGLQVQHIHSEYGMTELLSQSYSKGHGRYLSPPWKKILIRDTNDPMSYMENEKSGGINIIDLANVYSCSFIATNDLGKINSDQYFEVLGRFDESDIRGCNLMYQ